MKRRIYAVLILLSVVALGTACAFQSDQTADSEETETENYRVTITDEEMEAGYASFQMDERIYFDASITPTSVYENGVDSYFLISNCVVEDEDEVDEEDGDIGEDSEAGDTAGNTETVNDENTIYGYSLEEFYDLLADYSTVDFTESGTDWRPTICTLWLSTDLAYDPTDMYPSNFLIKYLSDPGGDLSYATAEEQASKIKEFLENLTDLKISDNWKCYTYSRENLQAVIDAMEEEDGSGSIIYDPYDLTSDENPISVEIEEFYEFYSFWFSFDINGVSTTLYPVSGYQVRLGADETPGEYLEKGLGITYTINSYYIYLNPIRVTASEEGILYAWIDLGWSLGDVYKEAEEVLSASEILLTCEGYLQSEVNVDTITVRDMSLVYDAGVTDKDKEDGVVDVVLRPYWVVSTYNSWSNLWKRFIFDARTGNLVDEQEVY